MADQTENQQESKSATAPPSGAELLPAGTIIDGKYEVIAHIGSGGMGEVYKVFATSTQSYFALKMLSPELAAKKLMAKRLENEARAARTLAHGNIVSIYDVGESSTGAPYLVMDYIEGDSLEDLLKKEKVLTHDRAIGIFIQIAEALVHARQKGVLHRDLKPSNIIVAKTPGGGDLIKIVDFGIAKVTDQESVDKTKLTQTGELIGTPLYMSPEQCKGEDLDARSDLYSFGCIMFEMLAGYPAFAADNQVLVILKHLSDDRPKLPAGVGINQNLKEIINRCLEKDPADRYDNAVTLQIDLERVHDGKPLQPHKRRVRSSKEHKTTILTAAIAGVLIAGALIPVTLQSTSQHGAVVNVPAATKPDRPEVYNGKTLAQWTDAIEKTPDDPELYFSRGKLHAARDERTNAIDDFTQAISLKPNFVKAYCERSVTYALIANYDNAEKDAKQAVKLNPESTDGYEALGWVYGAREQSSQAIAAWKKAISIDNSGYYQYHLATQLLRLARYNEADRAIQSALEDWPESPTYRGISGMIAVYKRDFPKALEEFKQATASSKTRGVEWQEFAYYYVCTGNMPEAERMLQHAKSIETFPARSYRLAGELYRTAGMFDNAIQQFSASTSLEEYPPGYRERALVYIELGQWRSAYEDLKKSLQLNPYSVTTLSYIAMVESHLRMTAKADEHIAAAFKGGDIPPINYVNRALIEQMKGNKDAAMNDANKAISLDPYLKEAYAVRATIDPNSATAAADKDKAKTLVSHLDL